MADIFRDVANLKNFRDDILSAFASLPDAAVKLLTDKFQQSQSELEIRLMARLDQLNDKVDRMIADAQKTSDALDSTNADLDALNKRVQDDLGGLQKQHTDDMAMIDPLRAKIAALQAQIANAPADEDTAPLQAKMDSLSAFVGQIQAKNAQIQAKARGIDSTKPDVVPPTPPAPPENAIPVDDAASPVSHLTPDEDTKPSEPDVKPDPVISADPVTVPVVAEGPAPEGNVPTPQSPRRNRH